MSKGDIVSGHCLCPWKGCFQYWRRLSVFKEPRTLSHCSWAPLQEKSPYIGHECYFFSWSCPGGHSIPHAASYYSNNPLSTSGWAWGESEIMRSETYMASIFLFYFLFLLNKPISSLHPVPGTVLAALHTLTPLILTVTLLGAHCFYKRRNWGSEKLSNVSITEPASWEAFRLQGSSQSTEMVSYLSCPAQRVDLAHKPYTLSSLHIVAGFPHSITARCLPITIKPASPSTQKGMIRWKGKGGPLTTYFTASWNICVASSELVFFWWTLVSWAPDIHFWASWKLPDRPR